MALDTVIKFIIEVILASGGAAIIVSAILTFLGKNWIDNRFQQGLEEYKWKQQQELEQYKYQINTLFNRITRIHEKEIEILPIAWGKLQDTHGFLSQLINPFRNHREFSQMDEQQLKEFQQEYEIVSKSFADFHNYLLHNSIFLSPDIHKEFAIVDKIFNETLAKSRIARQGLKREQLTLEAYENVYERTEPIKDKIRELIQQRLHHQEA